MQNFRTPNFCEWPSVVRVNNEKRGFDLLARFLNGLRPMKVKRLLVAPIFSALLLASGSVCAADSARASDEQQLTKIENDWAISYVKRDTAFLQRITSGDFAFVGQYAFTDVFVKQKGEWKAVSGQVTPVAKDFAND